MGRNYSGEWTARLLVPWKVGWLGQIGSWTGPMVSCGKRSINPEDSDAGKDFKGYQPQVAAADQHLNHRIQGGPGERALQASDPINLISHASSRVLWLLGNSLRSYWCSLIPRLLSLIPHLLLSSFFLPLLLATGYLPTGVHRIRWSRSCAIR